MFIMLSVTLWFWFPPQPNFDFLKNILYALIENTSLEWDVSSMLDTTDSAASRLWLK